MSEENQATEVVEPEVETTSMVEALAESDATEQSAPEDILEVEGEPEVKPTDGEENPEPEVDSGKKKTATPYQKRINELTWGKKEAQRIAERAAQEAEYWKKMAMVGNQGVESNARPDSENFATMEEYEDAVYSWRRNQEIAAEREEAEKAHIQSITQTFNERSIRIKAEHPDFDEVVKAPVFSPVMNRQIYESDHGPEIAYFLGLPDNHSLARQIGKLPLEKQIAEMAKLELRISESRPQKITKATPPIKPVGTSASTVVADEDLTTKERVEKLRKERIARMEGKYKRK